MASYKSDPIELLLWPPEASVVFIGEAVTRLVFEAKGSVLLPNMSSPESASCRRRSMIAERPSSLVDGSCGVLSRCVCRRDEMNSLMVIVF
jgi:hypothetical protein